MLACLTFRPRPVSKAIAICAALCMFPASVQAQEKDAAEKTLAQQPEVVQSLFACRTITDAEARLRCYDTQTAALQQASQDREVVMVDKEQIKKTRRGLFGLSLPNMNIFGGGKNDEESERVLEVEGIIAQAQLVRRNWFITLEDGAKWVQTDARELIRDPHKGSAIKIRAAALGSYLANIDGQTAIRVKRVN